MYVNAYFGLRATIRAIYASPQNSSATPNTSLSTMTTALPRKDYVDKAIQTVFENSSMANSRRAIASATGGSALDSDRLSTANRYAYIQPQVLYRQPIRPKISGKRIVSLPETSLDISCHDKLMVVPGGPSTRVVSLSRLPDHLRMKSTLDDHETLSDTSILSSGGDSFQQRNHDFTSLATPPTTSPPSSPESILIIGMDPHVPPTFTRHGYHLHTHDSEPHSNDGGMIFYCLHIRISESHKRHQLFEAWIAWASSPPRPIPALHGPLSLPYARCPS